MDKAACLTLPLSRSDGSRLLVPQGPSRPRLTEFFEHRHESGVGADWVEVWVGRDFLGTLPAVLEGEAEGVEGSVGVLAGELSRIRGGGRRCRGTG